MGDVGGEGKGREKGGREGGKRGKRGGRGRGGRGGWRGEEKLKVYQTFTFEEDV